MEKLSIKNLPKEIEQAYENSLTRKYWGSIGRFLARVVGRKDEAPLWVSMMVAMALVQAITQIILIVQREPANSPVSFPDTLPMLVYLWFAGVIFHSLIKKFIHQLKTTVVEALNMSASNEAVRAWLHFVNRRFTQWIILFILITLFASTTIYVLAFQNTPVTFPVYFFNIMIFAQLAPHMFWLVVITFTFVFSLRGWKLKLFQDDPARTYVIQVLHQISSNVLFSVAFLMALNLILVIPLKLYSQTYLLMSTFMFWVPALLYFWLTEVTFSQLIQEAKFKRLTTIQKQINAIETEQNMAEKEPAEAVTRLLNLHDRVKSVSVSMINTNAIANLLGSLALPLLAVLANLFDIWQQLFNSQ